MPAKHRYKCLNYDRCPAYNGSKSASGVFVSMNSPQPMCPWCGAIKLEDWGEARNFMTSSSAAHADAQRIDTGLDQIAARHGMTDMSNKDGKGIKAVKSMTGEARGDYGSVKVAGVNVPVDHNPTCSRLPVTSHLKVKPNESPSAARANVLSGAGT